MSYLAQGPDVLVPEPALPPAEGKKDDVWLGIATAGALFLFIYGAITYTGLPSEYKRVGLTGIIRRVPYSEILDEFLGLFK